MGVSAEPFASHRLILSENNINISTEFMERNMNILIELSDFDINNVFFQETKRNVIIDGDFSKILYSTPDFVMNGIYLRSECICQSYRLDDKWSSTPKPTHSVFESQPAHKILIDFDPYSENNQYLVNTLCALEEQLVNHYKQMKMIHKYNPCNLKHQLLNGVIRLNMPELFHWTPSLEIVLKIAGVWETATQVGITFKFQPKESERTPLRIERYCEYN